MTQTSLSPRAWAELTLLALIWGASFLSIRLALFEIGPAWVVAHRTLWAALALWLVVAVSRQPLPRSPRVWGAFLVMGCLNNVLPFTLMAWGQQHIETGLTSILNAGTALWGVLFAAVIFADERLTFRRASGVALGVAGVALAVGPDALSGLDLTSLAQLAVIGGTISYALAAVWARRRLSGLSPVLAAAGMLGGAALVSVPLAFVLEGPPHFSLTPTTLGSIAYFSLIATAGAYLLYYRVLAMAGSGNLMLVTLMIPPTAILLGAVVLDETLEPTAYAGFAILALGLAVMDGRLFRLFRSASPAP